MSKRTIWIAVLATVLLTAGAGLAAEPSLPAAGVAFDGETGVIELKQSLKEYRPSGAPTDNTVSYVFTAENKSDRPVTRVLIAGQPPGVGLALMPHRYRPSVEKVECIEPGVTVERTRDYGRRTFRISLPPKSQATLAVRMAGAAVTPSLLAWTEPALSSHNKWMAIFIAAVAGLIAAAAAIAGGLAVMSHHVTPRWAALMLLAMLLSRLAGIGLFDGSLVTSVGGPFGLVALFDGLALAAGVRLINAAVPFQQVWTTAATRWKWGEFGVLALAASAYVGLPGATVLVDLVCFAAAPAAAVYLTWRGRQGVAVARTLVPSTIVFVLQVLAATAFSFGVIGGNPFMPDVAGCFAAAAAVLLTLAMAAGEGVGVLAPARRVPVAMPAVAPHPAIEAIGASLQGVFEYDMVVDTVTLSREAARMIGIGDRSREMRHAEWTARIHSDDRPVYAQALQDFGTESGLAFRIEFRVCREDGCFLWLELRATMKGPQRAPATRCVGLIADVTARKESDAAAVDRSLRDPLTGLGNRVALMEALEGMGEALHSVACALIDIDRFKAIHASLGDDGGDRILTLTAERLDARFGETAALFRVGGDSFALLLKSVPDDPGRFGDEVVTVCAEAHRVGGRSIYAPASAGLALGRDARDPLNLLSDAEMALRQAKRMGGGCCRIYASGMEAQAPMDSVALEADLRRALDAGEIELFYQPIMRLKDRAVAGFEALMRWRHPTKGLIGSDAFIKHAEESGLIADLGRYALRRATDDLIGWQRYFPLAEPLFVSVNLSRRQLFDDGFEAFLAELLRSTRLLPSSLVLEVTESTAVSPDGLAGRLSAIRALGVGLAIDDFGAGMSSLSALRDLPFDIVKIDKSFLSRRGDGAAEADGGVILSSIVAMAHDLKRRVVVEGVESEEDAAHLAELGCEYAQGFLFAEPISLQETLKFVARHFRAQK